jgi:SAM-dependent methyltransferase
MPCSTDQCLNGAGVTDTDIERQRDQWRQTFARRRDFLGAESSEPAAAALARFETAGVHDLVELGAGQGRDTLLFADAGLHVAALDYAEEGLAQLSRTLVDAGLAARVDTVTADVRRPLPFEDGTFDAGYAHLLFCMALTTPELERLTAEVRRVLRPGGLLVYTVRTTADAHFGAGISHGDDMFEMGGFIVHFFDRALVDHLAVGFEVLEVADYEEGKLPRRMFGVTMRRADPA